MCNEVRIHLWEASDEGWRSRSNDSPVCTGAESFIAGTASCRIEVEGIDELYQHIKPLGILHPNTSLKDQWWDERDFAVIDPDNNLIREGANKQVISSQADSLIKISRIWADFFPANTSNQPI
ncbi:hypothetical protein VEE69_44960 (plasmid) [Escherichia coli]|nr:hypothetical protein VEE69_44960 [Escherichia coli]